MREKELSCVVSGSFKFKPEIDRTINELRDEGVLVLAPEKGWLWTVRSRLINPRDLKFRPLPDERDMTPRQVEDSFLEALSKSDFVYIVDPSGYVGNSVALEMAVAYSLGIPIYSSEPISKELDSDPQWKYYISLVKTMGIGEAVRGIRSAKTK